MIFQSERQLRTLRFPVGDKRPPRGGQTGMPFAAFVECVDYQLFAKPLKKEAAQGIKNRIV